ncbi:MAG: cytochrome c oxidase assembly protein [Actinomycetota bacterium]
MTSTAARSPGRAVAWLLGVLPVAIIALAAGLAFTGAARPNELVDPGTLVRWGLPVVTVVARVAAFVTIGAFGICALVLAGPGRGSRSRQVSPAWSLAARIGTVSAVTWALAQVAHVVFGYAQVWGRPLDSPTFGQELRVFLTATELGITYFWAAVLAIVVSLFAVATAGMTMAAWTTVLGAVALVPIALTGHSQGAVAHNLAVSSMWLHLVPLALWVGGLATLGVVAHRLGDELPRAARRYSALALWCFALVGVSGVFSSVIRLNSPLELFTTSWGAVLGLKILLWFGLGVMGWLHRERTIPRLADRPGLFWRLAGVEVLVMGAVSGLAVVLGSSAPPVPQDAVVDPSAVFALSGYPEPPLPSVATWFTQWHPDPLYLVGAASAVVVYLTWVRRVTRRGDRWPVGRTISWVVAWVLFIWVTNGGPFVYGILLFSAHMVMHMTLVMLVPVFWTLAAPITLALRALPARRDGSRGPREWLLALLHSRWAVAWANPWVAGVNFAGSLFVFYYTDLLEIALTTHVGHVLMVVHFSLAGYMFANVIIGVDPGVDRPTYPVRLVLLFATMAFHAFFGLSLASLNALLAADYFGRLGLTWWVDAQLDQQIGGFVTWGIGEAPTLVLAIIMAMMWARADQKVAVRLDRKADRTGDAELEAYNRMLSERAVAMGRVDSRGEVGKTRSPGD